MEINEIKIKDTWADRRYKSTEAVRNEAIELYKKGGYTQAQVAEKYNISARQFSRWLKSPEERKIMLEARKITNKKYYDSKVEVREKIVESTRKSRAYKKQLLETKLNNLTLKPTQVVEAKEETKIVKELTPNKFTKNKTILKKSEAKNYYWFRLDRFDSKHHDYVRIEANSEKDAYQQMVDIFKNTKNPYIYCYYFSEKKTYPRIKENICNYTLMTEAQIRGFRNAMVW